MVFEEIGHYLYLPRFPTVIAALNKNSTPGNDRNRKALGRISKDNVPTISSRDDPSAKIRQCLAYPLFASPSNLMRAGHSNLVNAEERTDEKRPPLHLSARRVTNGPRD